MLGLAFRCFFGGKVELSDGEKKSAVPGVGSVSTLDARTVFVPGSISDATTSGLKFADAWYDKFGETPAYVNSNMPISDYPGQYFRSSYAKKRDSIIEEAVCSFVRSCDSKEVEIVAHSAGSAQALRAALKYKKEGGKKFVTVFLMGAGAPGSSIDPLIKELGVYGVEVENIVDRFDIVPRLAGSKDSMISKREVLGKPALTRSEAAINFLRSAYSPGSPHKMEGYFDAVTTRVAAKRLVEEAHLSLKPATKATDLPKPKPGIIRKVRGGRGR